MSSALCLSDLDQHLLQARSTQYDTLTRLILLSTVILCSVLRATGDLLDPDRHRSYPS